jgi:hypothetical protein
VQPQLEDLIKEIVMQEFAALAGGGISGFVAPAEQTQNKKSSVKPKKKKEDKSNGNRH